MARMLTDREAVERMVDWVLEKRNKPSIGALKRVLTACELHGVSTQKIERVKFNIELLKKKETG